MVGARAMPTVPTSRFNFALSPYAGMVPGDYNPNDVPLATFQRMKQRDPIIRYAYRHLTRSLRRRLGKYTHDDEKVAEWVNTHVLPTTMRHLNRLQKALYFGVAMAQPRYDLAPDGRLRLAELVGLAEYRFWDGLGFDRDELGRVDRVYIDTLGYVPFVDPETGVRQIIHYATGDDDGGPWGEASARFAYPAWYISSNLEPAEAMALDKYATGVGVAKVADDEINEETGKRHSEELAEAWAQMGSNSFIAIAEDDELTIVNPGWQVNSPFDPVLRRLNGYKFNAFWMPYLLTQEANMGSRSTVSVQLETYLMAETDLAEELADDVVNDQIVTPAVAQQFGPNAGPGKLTVLDPSPPDLEAWSHILQALDSIGAFSAEADDQLAFVAERFGVPMDDLRKLGNTALPVPVAS